LGGIVLEVLERTVWATRCLVESFDPAQLSGAEAKAAVESFLALEKLTVAGRLSAAARLDETGAWADDGAHGDIDGFLAAASGTSVGAARGAMKTARRVRNQPKVEAAVRQGELSGAQADAITNAVDADPSAADDLLATARTAGFRGLRTECDRVIAAALSREDEAANDERIYRERSLAHQTMRDGSGRIEIQGPLDRTAQIMAALERWERERFEQNRAAKAMVHPDAVAFDALVAPAGACASASDGEPTPASSASASRPAKSRGGRPLATVVVHVSLDAYLRGWTEPGEICEIEAAGPISVANAYRLASDSFLEAVVGDGVDVTVVSPTWAGPSRLICAPRSRSGTGSV
jgi:hypothetical protein